MVLYLNESDVRQLLTMSRAVEEVERAFFRAWPRQGFRRAAPPHTPARRASAHSAGRRARRSATSATRPTTTGRASPLNTLLHMMNYEQGNTEAIIESDWVGRIRTGAADGCGGALSGRARTRASWACSVMGAMRAPSSKPVCTVRDDRRGVKVFGRNQDNVRAFCDEMSQRVSARVRAGAVARGNRARIRHHRDHDEGVRAAVRRPLAGARSAFVAATGSNALDRREIDTETVRRADVIVVDSARGRAGASAAICCRLTRTA